MKTKLFNLRKKTASVRFWEIDFARGIAILMMIVFHLVWDLRFFGFISINPYAGFWGYFQIATATLFLLLVGLMLAFGAQKYESKYPLHFVKRFGVVFSAALLITAVTYIIFPQNFIYFGILHLIAVAILLSIPFAKHRVIPLILGLFFISLPHLINLRNIGNNWFFWAGFSTPIPTFDFAPLFPWFGAVLIGISIGNLLYKNCKRRYTILLPENKSVQFIISKIQLLGKNSLLVYSNKMGLIPRCLRRPIL